MKEKDCKAELNEFVHQGVGGSLYCKEMPVVSDGQQDYESAKQILVW